jgi:hypothetical protein
MAAMSGPLIAWMINRAPADYSMFMLLRREPWLLECRAVVRAIRYFKFDVMINIVERPLFYF